MMLTQVRAAQPEWFSRGNKKFFGDVSYLVLYGRRTGERYLARSTYAWTDMFGASRRLHWRINRLKEDLRIGALLDPTFSTLTDVKNWLRTEEEETQ